MVAQFRFLCFCFFFFLLGLAKVGCLPEIAFPPPRYDSSSLSETLNTINNTINGVIAKGGFNTASFSVEVASSQRSLYAIHHTAEQPTARGTKRVDGSTRYRIASNTKLFTALGIMQMEAAGKLKFDDSVNQYVTDLPKNGSVDWSNITIRSLMAHLGGIFDNFADLDLAATSSDPVAVGLPPVSQDEFATFPKCGIFTNFTTPCSRQDLIQEIEKHAAVFSPRSQSTYSNVGYDLLGLVLSNVTGKRYEDAISANILQPLGMSQTTFVKPEEGSAVIPDLSSFDEAKDVAAPTGGLYSTTSDMIKFLQFSLASHNKISKSMNWFAPASYSPGSHSFLGYPWEIFRSASILKNSTRPVTIVTKGGGLVGYFSYSIVIPAYDLVIFMVAGGQSTALPALNQIFNSLPDALVQAAEGVAQKQLATDYAGTYSASTAKASAGNVTDTTYKPKLNSSITISQSDDKSLFIQALTSNSTELLSVFKLVAASQGGFDISKIYFQFIPTFQTRQRQDVSGGVGEVWRFINVLAPSAEDDKKVWTGNDYCVSLFDPLNYAEKPIVEAIFWRGENGTGRVEEVEMTALKIRMGRT